MLLSLEPFISQLCATSQSATPLSSSSFFFSSMLCGMGEENTAENTFQKRFCGCP